MDEEAQNRYLANKKRAMYVLGIKDEDSTKSEVGQTNATYEKMGRIINAANDYWTKARSNMYRPSNTQSRLHFDQNVPQELAELGVHVNWDSGLLCRKPDKRCHKCFDNTHDMKYCPYKLPESRTPEIEAMIQQRYMEVREREINDPLLSKGYKAKMFRGQRELRVKEQLAQTRPEPEGKRKTSQNDVKMEDAGAGGVKVKVEPGEQEQEVTAKMQNLNAEKNAASSDNLTKKKLLIQANQDLRKAISILNQRQLILQEYVETELGGSKGARPMDRYLSNKTRVKHLMMLDDVDDEELYTEDGQRTETVEQMLQLLKIANNYWKRERARVNHQGNPQSRFQYEQNVPKELAELGLFVDWDDGRIKRKPIKKCNTCFDESHDTERCPYKLAESRTPEIEAMIQERYIEVRKREVTDPLISKSYKAKTYHPNVMKERRRGKQERKAQKTLNKLKQRMAEGIKIGPKQIKKIEDKLKLLQEKKGTL